MELKRQRYHPLITLLWESLGILTRKKKCLRILGKPVQAMNHVRVEIVYVPTMRSTHRHGHDTRVPRRFNWPAQASPSPLFNTQHLQANDSQLHKTGKRLESCYGIQCTSEGGSR